MNKAYIKCFIQKRLPTVKFETDDGFGTQHPEHQVHCLAPERDIHLIEKAARDMGKVATRPIPSTRGHDRIRIVEV